MEQDPEIRHLIRGWAPPDPALGMDERMERRLAARRSPLWTRRFELRVSIPAPLVAAALLVAVVLGNALYRSRPQHELLDGMRPIPEPVLTVIGAEGNQ
jgi:hypothetical protein